MRSLIDFFRNKMQEFAKDSSPSLLHKFSAVEESLLKMETVEPIVVPELPKIPEIVEKEVVWNRQKIDKPIPTHQLKLYDNLRQKISVLYPKSNLDICMNIEDHRIEKIDPVARLLKLLIWPGDFGEIKSDQLIISLKSRREQLVGFVEFVDVDEIFDFHKLKTTFMRQAKELYPDIRIAISKNFKEKSNGIETHYSLAFNLPVKRFQKLLNHQKPTIELASSVQSVQ